MSLFMLGEGGILTLKMVTKHKLLKFSMGYTYENLFETNKVLKNIFPLKILHINFKFMFFIHRHRNTYFHTHKTISHETILLDRYAFFKMHCIFQFTSSLVIIVQESTVFTLPMYSQF